MSISKRIHFLLDEHGITAYALSNRTGISEATLSRLLRNENAKPNGNTLKKLSEHFNVSERWILTGKKDDDDIFAPDLPVKPVDKKKDALKQLDSILRTNTKDRGFVPDTSGLVQAYTTVIPVNGQAGLFQTMYDEEYIDQNFERKVILVEPDERGEYYDLGVGGNSMNPTLMHNDKVRCSEISRMYWRESTLFKKEHIYCFWHNKRGIIYKRVVKNASGLLTLRSDNPDKSEYPDFQIEIEHCTRILQVRKIVERDL